MTRRALLMWTIALWPACAWAHEERLIVGRVEAIEPSRKLLVVVDVQRGDRRRLEVNQETEVLACRASVGLAAVRPGGLVRIKYLDRAGAEPDARSILLLGAAK
ncbi:MAG: hypothetical protein C5B48_03760 [Candidatus Rokuibacteriota bacterium]|nr:MAG: hypothetical protein C5B48_03760 [Candidatus Rokubacteria bacterium]